MFLREVKKIILGMTMMSKLTYIILCGSLLLSCAVILAAFALLISIGELSLTTYPLFLCAKELMQLPASLLLVASIVAVVVEEHAREQQSPKK